MFSLINTLNCLPSSFSIVPCSAQSQASIYEIKGVEVVGFRILNNTREVVYKHSMHMPRALKIANDFYILILAAKFSEYLIWNDVFK